MFGRPSFQVAILITYFFTVSAVTSEPIDRLGEVQRLQSHEARSLKQPVYWFSLGDSYSETGFNASGTLPSPGNPLGNPAYPGWTGTGENPNWVDYLTTTYNQSLILTYNLARGGATINSSLVTPGQGISLEDEVNTFLNRFAQKPPSTPWNTWNTLFSVWIGINDIGYTYNNGGDRNAAFLPGSLYSGALRSYSDAGARLLLFINVPPVDRSPLMLSEPAQQQAAERVAIDEFNRKLDMWISWFQENHTDVWVWRWDSHAAFTAILDDPTSYGFQDTTSYGTDDTYFWSNSYHPGRAAHKIFAKEISDLLEGSLW